MEFVWTILAIVGPSTEDKLFQQVLCAVFLIFFLDSVGIDGPFNPSDKAHFMLFMFCAAFWWNENS